MKVLITIFLLLPSVCCYAQVTGKELLKLRLDSVLSANFKDNEPGGSVLIQKGETVIYSRSFGLSDIQTKNKFSENTVSNTGSISKTFIAYGILILQQQGKLSIEDNVLKYFPDFKNPEIAKKVKLKHLITHTSGLPDSRNVGGDSIFYLTAKDEENFAPLKLTETLEFEPGSQWKYSNPAYNGLALIIEKVSGMKWQRFIEKYIFEPSGMKDSKITDGPYPDKDVAHGYRKMNGTYHEYDYGEFTTFAASGNGGIWSSVADLKKYVAAIKKCVFVDCKTISFSQTAWKPDNWDLKSAPAHGYSWFIDPINYNGSLSIHHSGSQGGFRAHLLMFPKPDITIIWLTNNNRSLTPFITEQLVQTGYLK